MPRTGLAAAEIRTKAVDIALAHMRRHGFEKVRLTDVAKDLGVTHVALYAHFCDKAALFDAVTERWFIETRAALEEVCRARKDPLQKIRDWFLTLYRVKRERALRDPEPYRAFDVATALQKPFVIAHLAAINRQLVGLVKEAADTLTSHTPQQQAAILYEATATFHHPKLVAADAGKNKEALLERILDTLLIGMACQSATPSQ